MTNKHHARNRPHYPEDEEYYQQNNNWNFDQPDPFPQPDLFEPYTRNEQTRQTRHSFRNRPHYSVDEKYYQQNQLRFNTNQQNKTWNFDQPDFIYQPDLFEPYTRNEQTRQTRHSFRNRPHYSVDEEYYQQIQLRFKTIKTKPNVIQK